VLWDLLQQRQIGMAKNAAAQAGNSAARAEKDIAELERVIESLMLGCQAMWELMREHTDLNDEMFLKRMEEVDLRNGKRDGRIGLLASKCASCSRPNSARRDHCVYCGTPLPPTQHVFG
jgi:hypothetical protein